MKFHSNHIFKIHLAISRLRHCQGKPPVYGWIIFLLLFPAAALHAAKSDTTIIHFSAIANGRPLVAGDSSYKNVHGEGYQINRLQMYVSNLAMGQSTGSDVYLINVLAGDSITVVHNDKQAGMLQFTLGVDSALNCSGAQEGALDPLLGMFWTWNSGYIFFKLEGFSPASTGSLGRIEHHIGGYRSPFNAARKIVLPLPKKYLGTQVKPKHLYLRINLDKYWQSSRAAIKIADQALLMAPGAAACRIANQFTEMFEWATPE